MAHRGKATAVAVQTGLAGPDAYDHLPGGQAASTCTCAGSTSCWPCAGTCDDERSAAPRPGPRLLGQGAASARRAGRDDGHRWPQRTSAWPAGC